MILRAILQGMLDSNCYILGDEGEAAVIDPGADVEDIAHALDEQGLKLKYIIMTHAHIDHIAQVDNLRSTRGGKTVIHEADAPLLGDRLLNGSALFGLSKTYDMADVLVKDGDVLELGDARLEIVHTPGHTPGGICLLVSNGEGEDSTGDASGTADAGGTSDASGTGDAGGTSDASGTGGERVAGSCIFTGDTLFRLSVGRTDLGAGDHRIIKDSLRRLMELDGSLKVYPGHGPATTIDYERRNNPWL